MLTSLQKVSSHVLWKIETLIEENTKYKKHCTQDNDASVSFNVGTLELYTVLPIAISCPIIFSWMSLTVWNLFLFKGDFSFGKSQKSQGAKSGMWGSWVTWGIWCFAKNHASRDAWVNNDDLLYWSVGAVDTVEWVCVLFGHHIQNDWASRAKNLHQILH